MPGIGDRVLARITKLDEVDVAGFTFEGEAIKKLPREKRRLLGIYRANARAAAASSSRSTARNCKTWPIAQGRREATPRTAISCASTSRRRGRFATPRARVVGGARQSRRPAPDQPDRDPRARHPGRLPRERDREMRGADAAARWRGRTDLRDTAAADHRSGRRARSRRRRLRRARYRPEERGRLRSSIVAIADVAHYVRPGTKLDREAQLRGNSVYFPDRVVPMLPEHISNDLCSLREGEERAVPRRAHGVRPPRREAQPHVPARDDAVGRQALLSGGAGGDRRQSVREGRAAAGERAEAAVGGLCGARQARATSARRSTSTCPSARSCSTTKGRVDGVVMPERLEAHRLIEEFMIQANVAAAETLEAAEVAARLPRPRRALEGEAEVACAISSKRST